MDFYEAINSRRTIRDFENVAIEDETIERIISAGMKAPTNDHMRDWHYIIIRDKDTVMKLLDIIPKGISEEDMNKLIQDWNLSDNEQQEAYRNAVPKQYRMLMDASAIIIPLLKQKTDMLHPDNISHLNGFASIWCSIENIFLASTAEGYACTLRVPLGNEGQYARDVLEFPDDYFMPCFIGVGKPKKDAPIIKQKNINIQERIHWNKW
jgi:nitroreductase